jgi:hypothetical protein
MQIQIIVEITVNIHKEVLVHKKGTLIETLTIDVKRIIRAKAPPHITNILLNIILKLFFKLKLL